MSWVVGIDVGGTFTDFYLSDTNSGQSAVFKVSSTPDHPEQAIIRGLQAAAANLASFTLEDISFIGHGTTVGTNALLERDGARVAMLVTRGFRDVLEIGRQARSHLYDLQQVKNRPLVERRDVIEVAERTRANGDIELEVGPDEIERVLNLVTTLGPQAVAICFLNSYANPGNELRLAAAIESAIPDLPVTVSSILVRELREVERFTTATANAFLMPKLREYFSTLRSAVDQMAGLGEKLYVMQSDGGLGSVESSIAAPIRLSLSGPAAGVVAAGEVGRQASIDHIITLDMGGTSTDVALVRDGEVEVSHDAVVSGHTLRIAALNIHTVGAGGGSIAYEDDGLLKVGPRSSGAKPGPAAYGLGGENPTVTDAQVVLGRIADSSRFGDEIVIRRDLAITAMERIGRRLNLGPAEVAMGVVRVANANIARAVSKITVERGVDPRAFALVPYGGAGPLHACEVAELMGISQVVIPRYPGALSALGLVVGDRTSNFSRSEVIDLDRDAEADVRRVFQELAGATDEWFEREGIKPERRRMIYSVDMRHKGQNYELNVRVDDPSEEHLLQALRKTFISIHHQLYGYSLPSDPLVAITFRAKAVGLREASPGASRPETSPSAIGERETRYVQSGSQGRAVPVHRRESFATGDDVVGPCIIEQGDSTAWIPPRWRGRVDVYGNLVLSFG